ncbi:cell division protein ZapA [Palleronia caenipelagi]|uniref:Cell division protein ZapA n=1 Tax=Palleronia caenipelagi TaxID=2489174 RepID=A0A547PXJ7_9RHOB|nr:cell division protein ZapA [Palleronia caenipelagi]TRD18865.1 cell division protein ZapA [Palleronia caenipelagi]
MPNEVVSIGGRSYEVACQPGEEQVLHAAAQRLDQAATSLSAQPGAVPEMRMLLMSGLIVADRIADLESSNAALFDRIAELESQLGRSTLAAQQANTVEVPVMPEGLEDRLRAMVERAEALADQADPETETARA